MERTTLVLIFALLFAMASRAPVDTDTWWHLQCGTYTLANGMLYEDVFSHTFNGADWINHSWGGQIIMVSIYDLAGDVGLSIYTAVLAVAGMALLLPVLRGNIYLRSFVMVLGAATAAVFWAARPQMFSFLFSCFFLLVLYSWKMRGVDRLWLLPPAMLIWGNLHAGFAIGFLFLFAAIVGESLNLIVGTNEPHVTWGKVRKLLLIFVASVVLLAISPYGTATWLVPFETLSMGALREFIQEWNTPNFQGTETWPFIGMIILLFGAAWASRHKFDFTGFFLVMGPMFMGLLFSRNISMFAVAATVVLTHLAADALQTYNWELRPRQKVTPMMGRLNVGLIIVVFASTLIYLFGIWSPQTIAEAQAESLPVAAVDYLLELEPEGQLFNAYNWGGYILFRTPQFPVFIDGRTDLYDEFVRTYVRIATASIGWRDLLEDYNVNTVLVEVGSGLDATLRDEPGWRLAYVDDLAVIHLRETPLPTGTSSAGS